MTVGAGLVAGQTLAQPRQPIPSPDSAVPVSLPPTPGLPNATRSGFIRVNDASLFYAEFGRGEPVLFLHGGLANANYWGNQVAELAKYFRVIVMDTRGHGRSTLSSRPFSYSALAADVLAVLDSLRIDKASIVGWSDGAIVGIELALKRADRLAKLAAFGANFSLGGYRPGGAGTATFSEFVERSKREYSDLSGSPQNWPKLLSGLRKMWGSEPAYTAGQLASIRLPVLVMGGEHDEIIRREHTEALAAAIPGAKLVMEVGVSHFAMIQNPAQFNRHLLEFVGK